MKNILSFVIAVIMLMLCVGCNSATLPNITDAPDSSTVQTIEQTDNVVIASNEKAVYNFIRFIDASEEEVRSIIDLKSRIKEKFGIEFSITTDWTVPGKEPSPDAPEIIIGLSDRHAVRQTAEKLVLGRGECAIEICENNKIVIIAPDFNDLKIGFDYFFENLEFDSSSQLIYTGGNFYSQISEGHILSNLSELSAYKIVYDKNGENKSYAESLANSFKRNLDIELEVVPETEPKTEREIIVGKISDKSRFDYDFSSLSALEYSIVTSEKSILIAASKETLNMAVKTFVNTFIKSGHSISLNFKADWSVSYNTFVSTDTALAEGADTRIMSFNILSEEWSDTAVMEGRDIRVSAVLLNYRPDVAALQEVSNKWYSVLPNYISEVYEFTRTKTPSGSGTYTALVYNTETTKLIEEGIQIYQKGNSSRLRSIVWGIFESIATSERYIVFSTHWDASADSGSVRISQAEEMADFVNTMRSKYGLDIFACGDYNAKESTTEYKTFMEKSGFADAKKHAQYIKKACNTYHTLFKNLDTSSFESIDHITFHADTAHKVLFYNTLYHDYIIDASDHCPIYVDIKLSK